MSAQCPSNGSRTALKIALETSLGVSTITASDSIELPFVSTDLNLSRTLLDSSTMNGKRQKLYQRLGNKSVAGSVSLELNHNADIFLESLMGEKFSGGSLKVGDDPD